MQADKKCYAPAHICFISDVKIDVHIYEGNNLPAAPTPNKSEPKKDDKVTTIGIEESEKSPDQDTVRKQPHPPERKGQNLPRRDEVSNMVPPMDNDEGEKAVNTVNGDLPSGGQEVSRRLSWHEEEEQMGQAKFVVGSGEVDLQDLR